MENSITKIVTRWEQVLLRVAAHYARQFKVKLPRLNAAQAPYFLERISIAVALECQKPQMLILSGASGSGKGTIGRELTNHGIIHLPRITTRKPRPGERQGKNYFFVTKEKFKTMIAQGALIVWAETFGEYRGTSKKLLAEYRKRGKPFYIEGTTKAYAEFINHPAVKKIPNLSIEILPPTFSTLIKRLHNRPDQVPGDEYIERLKKAIEHLAQTAKQPYDVFIVNDSIERVVKVILGLLA